MKVLFLTISQEVHEGSSKALLQLLDGLIPLGIKPLIVLPSKRSLYSYLKQQKIPCIVIQSGYRMSVYPWADTIKNKILFIPRLLGRLIINSLATLKLLCIVNQFKPNLIHTNMSVISIGYYVARFFQIPHIWHIREYGALDINTFYYYPTFRHQLRRYKKNNSYTLCITKDIQRYNKLATWKNSKVLYDGVLPASSVTHSPKKRPYFLFAGRFEPIKGILPLIDAYATYCQIHPTPLPLHIAGNGTATYTKLLTDKIANYHLEDKVILLGMRNDILSLYKEAKAFIVPSLFEGFGLITAEAMFSGCLVIGNDTAGTKEQFDNGKEITGEEIGLRYNTQEQLVQHLIDVTNNSIGYYTPMILRAQQVVSQLYSTETHVKNVYNLYNRIQNNVN